MKQVGVDLVVFTPQKEYVIHCRKRTEAFFIGQQIIDVFRAFLPDMKVDYSVNVRYM